MPTGFKPFSGADVSRDDVAIGGHPFERLANDRRPFRRPVITVERNHLRVALAVQRQRHFRQLLAHVVVHHAVPYGRFFEAAAIRAHGGVAVHEQIILDAMIASAADEHRPVDLEEHVSKNLRAADAIVHVNTHRTHADAAGMMNEIVADFVPAKRVVASGIDRADVARLQRDMMNLVKLDHMIVAPVKDGAVRVIVDEIVRGAQADPGHRHRRHVTLGPTALPLEMAILDEVPGWRKRLTVATRQRHAAVTGIKYVTAHDAVTGAAFDHDAAVAGVADKAAHDAIARAAVNLYCAGTRGFEYEAAEGDVGDAGELQQGLREER